MYLTVNMQSSVKCATLYKISCETEQHQPQTNLQPKFNKRIYDLIDIHSWNFNWNQLLCLTTQKCHIINTKGSNYIRFSFSYGQARVKKRPSISFFHHIPHVPFMIASGPVHVFSQL